MASLSDSLTELERLVDLLCDGGPPQNDDALLKEVLKCTKVRLITERFPIVAFRN